MEAYLLSIEAGTAGEKGNQIENLPADSKGLE